METFHNPSTTRNIAKRLRPGMTFIGIVTAIICTVIFLRDLGLPQQDGNRNPGVVVTQAIVTTDVLVKIKDMTTTSAFRILK